jgi:hypothetical protein
MPSLAGDYFEMKFNFLSLHSRSLFSGLLKLIVLISAGTAFSAPTFDEILSTGPKNVIGPFERNPTYNLTRWYLDEFSSEQGKMSVTFKTATLAFVREYLISEGFFRWWGDGGDRVGPTQKLIESTRPDPLDGGAWSFRYSGVSTIASWTWTQDAPPVATNTGANVSMSLDLNRAVARSLRGKESRAAVSLLERQRKLLRDALAAAN